MQSPRRRDALLVLACDQIAILNRSIRETLSVVSSLWLDLDTRTPQLYCK
jgi:hypothetical protein